jgi:hypothetical protein
MTLEASQTFSFMPTHWRRQVDLPLVHMHQVKKKLPFMEMKPHEKTLRRNPLSDAAYQNSGMVLNGQGPGRHPLGDAPYLDLDTVLNEQGLGRRILSDALHRRPGVVKK